MINLRTKHDMRNLGTDERDVDVIIIKIYDLVLHS